MNMINHYDILVITSWDIKMLGKPAEGQLYNLSLIKLVEMSRELFYLHLNKWMSLLNGGHCDVVFRQTNIDMLK